MVINIWYCEIKVVIGWGKLEFKQLEAYIRVYELRSFSKAAEEMFVSQPSVSVYINSLEEELQTQLIYRSTKEFLPTEQGQLFYEYAKEMLSLRDRSIFSIKKLSDCTVGNIDIAASSVPAQYILPETFGAFHKLYPDITFNLEQADTVDVIKGIAEYKSEIGFVGAKIENPKCQYEYFMSEKLVIIAPEEERFQGVPSSDAARLLREGYFVTREQGSGTKLAYEECLKNIGVTPEELKVSACFNNTQSIILAVAKGLGLAIVSELAAKYYIQQKLITPIYVDSFPQRNFYIVLKKNRVVTPAVDLFVRFTCSYVGHNVEEPTLDAAKW